jgi:uncharacterized protein
MRALAGTVAAALLFLGGLPLAHAASHPFDEAPVRPAEYRGYARHAAYVPVTDGTRLAITWYTPTDGPANGRFPALLWYLPGHRETIDPRTGEIRTTMNPQDLAFFTSHGYVVALAEMRGSGASFGFREVDRGPQIGADGKDLVDWIAKQPWSDGTVGMIGASYQGFSQYATASHRPKALKAIFPEIAGFDDYTSLYYPGGILNRALSNVAMTNIIRDDLNYFEPEGLYRHFPSVPVVDEDGDGDLADEIPIDKDGSGTFLDDGQPTYSDGRPRKDIYYRATMAHQQNGSLPAEKQAAKPYRDSTLGDSRYRYDQIDPGEKPGAIAGSGIAIYSRGGWFDYHGRDSTMWYATLSGHTPTRLMMAPTSHNDLPRLRDGKLTGGGPYFAFSGDQTTSNDMMNREKLRFFDHFVRGLDNGFDKEPPVLIYVVPGGWRREDEWPLKRAQDLRLAFDAGHSLTETPGAAGAERWQVDLGSNSLSDGANRWNFAIVRATKPLSLDGTEAHRVAFTTEPLKEGREITGHPILDLKISSTTDESDVYAYLEDVAPDGTSLLVSEGELRANYHRLKPIQGMLPEGTSLKALPDLPWHGYDTADYDPHPFSGGKVVALRFDLYPTSWVFRAGHRIRISLAAADSPTFETHPAVGNADGASPPVWKIQIGAGESALILPWIRD